MFAETREVEPVHTVGEHDTVRVDDCAPCRMRWGFHGTLAERVSGELVGPHELDIDEMHGEYADDREHHHDGESQATAAAARVGHGRFL
jgi:hypothetical protein